MPTKPIKEQSMSEKRIISLLAAGTEIVCALGLQNQLVGISHECDFPEDIKKLPVCSSAEIDETLNSLQIDGQVKDKLSNALSIYKVDIERIKELKPDVIITQSQCEVCAVSLKDVERSLSDLINNGVEIISLQPDSLEDIFNDIEVIAGKLNADQNGLQLLEAMQERIDIIRHKLKFIDKKPKVVCIEWMSPLMTGGNWIPELIEIAGGIPLLSQNGKHSPVIDMEALRAADPEIIVISPCGFPIEKTLQDINFLLDLPGWAELSAVKNNQVFIADGNHYFNRSGPRIVDSLEILAEIIHPKQFVFGYQNSAWVQFSV